MEKSIFVDPRTNPTGPFLGRRTDPVQDVNELVDLISLCRAGRIYEVEKWIQAGKPIHAEQYKKERKPRVHSPLEIAIETRQYDLALLLLCNGFPPDFGDSSLLSVTMENRRSDFFELLIAWGADPLRVDVWDVLSTYNSDLYGRFWQWGLDFTEDHALARTLYENPSNRPAYGWARKWKDDRRIGRELAIALGRAVTEPREKAVALLMWAGADPRERVPNLRWLRMGEEDEPEEEQSTPLTMAIQYGHGHLLRYLKPDPSRDDFDELWSYVNDGSAVEHLGKIQPPKDWSPTIVRGLRGIVSDYGDRSGAKKMVETLTISHQARLTTLPPDEAKWLRTEILKCHDEQNCRWVLRWLSYPETCEPAIYEELMRTASIRLKAKAIHVSDSRYR